MSEHNDGFISGAEAKRIIPVVEAVAARLPEEVARAFPDKDADWCRSAAYFALAMMFASGMHDDEEHQYAQAINFNDICDHWEHPQRWRLVPAEAAEALMGRARLAERMQQWGLQQDNDHAE